MQQSAGQEHQPARQGAVHPLAHAGAQHQLAHQQEERHRHQDEVGVALPGFVAEDVPQRRIGKRLHHHQREHPQGAGDVQSNEEEDPHHAESGDDCHLLAVLRSVEAGQRLE